ncbi:hypothetical protein DRO30_03315 [Candidatus Bathyarchaeota archaeon]|nr:MAG: hypothetical protein DRO30_03315 [Candidatus Bathyarchaeota archaeon]
MIYSLKASVVPNVDGRVEYELLAGNMSVLIAGRSGNYKNIAHHLKYENKFNLSKHFFLINVK